MRRLAAVVVVVGLALGCQKASETSDAKRRPQPPPAPRTQPPSTLSIDVHVGERAGPPITAARLATTPPDFQDPERRAWKLTTLLGAAAAGTRFVVAGESAASLMLEEPASAEAPQPVLMLNRRGDVIATVASPKQPFPAFHGEGGRLHRPGDATPHLAGVTAIKLVPKR